MSSYNGRLLKYSTISERRKALYIKPFRSLYAFRSLLLSSVRLSVRLSPSHGGKPPHRQPSQLPLSSIDYCIYNIIYHTHLLLCDILLHNVLYCHTLYFMKLDIKSTEKAKVLSLKCLYFVLKCENIAKNCKCSINKSRERLSV